MENIQLVLLSNGGMDSEITEETATVLLESANFNDKSVRLTSKEHNLRTEASSRFEKGLDLIFVKLLLKGFAN